MVQVPCSNFCVRVCLNDTRCCGTNRTVKQDCGWVLAVFTITLCHIEQGSCSCSPTLRLYDAESSHINLDHSCNNLLNKWCHHSNVVSCRLNNQLFTEDNPDIFVAAIIAADHILISYRYVTLVLYLKVQYFPVQCFPTATAGAEHSMQQPAWTGCPQHNPAVLTTVITVMGEHSKVPCGI